MTDKELQLRVALTHKRGLPLLIADDALEADLWHIVAEKLTDISIFNDRVLITCANHVDNPMVIVDGKKYSASEGIYKTLLRVI